MPNYQWMLYNSPMSYSQQLLSSFLPFSFFCKIALPFSFNVIYFSIFGPFIFPLKWNTRNGFHYISKKWNAGRLAPTYRLLHWQTEKVISSSHLGDRFFTMDKWFENQTVILFKEEAKAELTAWSKSSIHYVVGKETKVLKCKENKNKNKNFKKKKTILTHILTSSSLAIKTTPESFPCFAYIISRSTCLGKILKTKENEEKNEISRYKFVKLFCQFLLMFIYFGDTHRER